VTRAHAPSGLQLLVRPVRAEASLWRRLRFEAESDCREELFNLYVGLARAIAWRSFRRRAGARFERHDFEQFAFEGLLQAIDRYDPMRGVPFGAYAARRIAGNIADGLARMSEVDAQFSHRRRLERERVRSLAAATEGESIDDAVGALSDLAVGLAIGLMLEGTGLVGGRHGADPAPSAYESLEWRELQARLAAEIARLPASEALVIRQHYDNGLSFARIAEMLELSRGRVSQLHRSALTRLRKRIGGFG
jgi:RNA polymerase sigma factor for flagellar operon FliA